MKYLFAVSALFLLCASLAESAEQKLPASERIPIIAFIGVNQNDTSDARYKELAEAGYSHNLWPWYPNAEEIVKALDAAQKNGIKIIAACAEFDKDPAPAVRKFGRHPALEAYYVGDEPTAAMFPKFAQLVAVLRAVDPKHWQYSNLLPSQATAGTGCATYQEYLDRFLAEVRPAVLSFDHYAYFSGTVDTAWYENLDLVAKTAKKAQIPFWAFILSASCNTYTITEANLRLETWTDLAYGAQAIQHFIYWHTNDDTVNHITYRDAPIEGVDGKRTKTYEWVKAINHEVIALSPIFYRSNLVQIGYVGAAKPNGISPFAAKAPVTEIKADGRGLLVAQHANGGKNYLVLVNRENAKELAITVVFDGSKKIAEVDKQGVLRPVEGKSFVKTIAPGDIAIASWDER